MNISHLMFHAYFGGSKPGKVLKLYVDNLKIVETNGSGGTDDDDSGGSGSKAKGLNYQYYEGVWSKLPNFNTLKPKKSGIVANFTLNPRSRNDNFGMRFKGYVNIKKAGRYTFYSRSDEGSKLFINDKIVVNNDGKHTARERAGGIYLPVGLQRIEVIYFEAKGPQTLAVRYKGPGFGKRNIPGNDLYRE